MGLLTPEASTRFRFSRTNSISASISSNVTCLCHDQKIADGDLTTPRLHGPDGMPSEVFIDIIGSSLSTVGNPKVWNSWKSEDTALNIIQKTMDKPMILALYDLVSQWRNYENSKIDGLVKSLII